MMEYEEKYQRTLREWQKFMDGNLKIDTAVIPEEIIHSWIRCRAMGLDPYTKPAIKTVPESHFKTILGKNKEFIQISRPYLQNFYRFLEGSGFRIVLFDHEGVVLDGIADRNVVERLRSANQVPGSVFVEKDLGTCASGMVIALKKPIQVFGAQHYNCRFHKNTASGAPIFDPDGNFLGIFFLVGRYDRVNDHTLGMAVAAAQAIENEMRTQRMLKEAQMANAYKNTVISSIMEALITIDDKGNILLINDNAREILALNTGQAEGKHLREILGKENQHLLKLIEGNKTIVDADIRIFSQKSTNEYTMTCNPISFQNGQTKGKVIVLNEIKRVKNIVARMIGAKANFRFEDICGKNYKFLRTLEQAKTVAKSNSNVLLLGKSGTGKDVFAQAIHNGSDRRNGPYVAINCAAMPKDLITSELFGYEEGAFTGSRRGGSQGKFELADGGTLFLDEIGEIPLELQPVLLRVMEDRCITRIGGTRVRPVNVRIISATNKNLIEEVRKGNFREDLFYRIHVFTIEMIPLGERLDDIPLFLDHFLKKYGVAMGGKVDKVGQQVIEAFMSYHWPGNIRELQNVVERMMHFAKTAELTVDLIPPEFNKKVDKHPDEIKSLEDFEKQALTKILNANETQQELARKMKISRMTLYRKRKKYGLISS